MFSIIYHCFAARTTPNFSLISWPITNSLSCWWLWLKILVVHVHKLSYILVDLEYIIALQKSFFAWRLTRYTYNILNSLIAMKHITNNVILKNRFTITLLGRIMLEPIRIPRVERFITHRGSRWKKISSLSLTSHASVGLGSITWS